MRISHPVPYCNDRLYLPQRVREWLQLPRTCRLYGRLIRDFGEERHEERAVILSPIPYEYWSRCYRVSVYTTSQRGAMLSLLQAAVDLRFDIVNLIASATSSAGELAVTAFISPGPDSDYFVSDASDIEIALRGHPALDRNLLRSPLIRPEGSPYNLRSISVSPLRLLQALGRFAPEHDSTSVDAKYVSNFVYDMTQSRLNFAKMILRSRDPDASNPDPALPVSQCLVLPDQSPITALVTSDPHECHLRVCLLPHPNSTFLSIRVPLRVSVSDRRHLRGIGRQVVEAVANAPSEFNIFHATSTTISVPTENTPFGAMREGDPSWPTERIHVRLVGDARRTVGGKAADVLRRCIHEHVQALSSADRQVVYDPEQPKAHEIPNEAYSDPGNISIRPLLAPLVFTATHDPHGLDDPLRNLALSLFANLKDCLLRPVFVPILSGGTPPSAQGQMTRILRACPMLVSLFLRDERLELKRSGADGPKFAPAAWACFEEAYLRGRGHFVYRLIHKDVFQPGDVASIRTFVYDDHTFVDAVKSLRKMIDEDMRSDRWKRLLVRCTAAAERGRITPEEISQKDSERAFLDTSAQSGK